MPNRNVELTDHQDRLVTDLVASGRYRDAEEVLREGLRLVEAREKEDAARLEALRDAARLGIESLERGEGQLFESFDDLVMHLDTVGEQAIAAALAERDETSK
ncbi:MAG: type II toxin-antitoxin system ParD family antitoxin [Alphaproteobacteria bacterium]|jgi:antitoxin ParD1/3/4|nr:type II toxin-antitoxin system ParD family antitoxin [Alphaproteobacteria bacterium]